MEPDRPEPAASVDDWDAHWDVFADSASDNPAQRYRRDLVMAEVRRLGPPRRVLDVGSGQGDLLAELRSEWPDAHLAGLELSQTGLDRTRAKVPDVRLLRLDLLAAPVDPSLRGWADVAVCSEVLEHVEHPDRLLRNAARAVAPGGRVIITVPGGPRSAFDRHIGHRQHYDASSLRQVIEAAGLLPEVVGGRGFPSFNLYKLAVLARGERLVTDAAANAQPSRLATAVMRTFGVLLRPRRCSSRWGWQMIAVARVPATSGPAGLDDC